MQEQILKDYLVSKSKEDLESIIINHYKFLVEQLEKSKRDYKSFLENNMNIVANSTKKELDFIFLQMRWYEDFIEDKFKEVKNK